MTSQLSAAEENGDILSARHKIKFQIRKEIDQIVNKSQVGLVSCGRLTGPQSPITVNGLADIRHKLQNTLRLSGAMRRYQKSISKFHHPGFYHTNSGMLQSEEKQKSGLEIKCILPCLQNQTPIFPSQFFFSFASVSMLLAFGFKFQLF